jgi:hypothetical protein
MGQARHESRSHGAATLCAVAGWERPDTNHDGSEPQDGGRVGGRMPVREEETKAGGSDGGGKDD